VTLSIATPLAFARTRPNLVSKTFEPEHELGWHRELEMSTVTLPPGLKPAAVTTALAPGAGEAGFTDIPADWYGVPAAAPDMDKPTPMPTAATATSTMPMTLLRISALFLPIKDDSPADREHEAYLSTKKIARQPHRHNIASATAFLTRTWIAGPYSAHLDE
jgi:hypothetical protein